jgi:hypothetical protein
MKLRALILACAALLAACAAVKRDEGPTQLEHYLAFAGEPIDRFNYPQRLRSWRPIGRDHLLVVTGTDRGYLLAVTPGCVGLQTSRTIAITTRATTMYVSSGVDEVRVERDRCRIIEIRPVDMARMREVEHAAKE